MARLRNLLSAAVLALALLPMGAAAVPTDTTDTPTEAVAKAEVLRLLNSGSVDKQERAVRLIGEYAHTGQFDADFFRLMVTPLHYIVARGKTEPLRIMAVSALYSIGTDSAMEGLRAQVDVLRSDRVAEITKIALAQHEADQAGVTQ